MGANSDDKIMKNIFSFSEKIKSVFAEELRIDKSKNNDHIAKQVNFLFISKQGLSNASKVYNQ